MFLLTNFIILLILIILEMEEKDMLINGEFVIQGCDQKRFFTLIKQEMENPEGRRFLNTYKYTNKHDAELQLGYELLKFNSFCKRSGFGTFLTKKFVGNEQILMLGIEVFDFLNGKTASESDYTKTYKAI